MIDSFIGKQPYFIQSLIEKLLLTPVNIPLVIICTFVAPGCEGCRDAVHEVGLEFYLGAEGKGFEYGCKGYTSFLMYLRKYSDIILCINMFIMVLIFLFVSKNM